ASMAILLGVFLIQGISPGPDMLTKHLDITYTMVWSIAIANIFGTGLCLLLTNFLARLANVRVQLLAPLVIVVVFLAAFQAKRHYGDLLLLLSFGFLGWLMKRFGWPRPPLILGLVLSSVLENYFFIAASHFGVTWLWRPIVLVIGALIVVSLVYGQRWTGPGMAVGEEPAPEASGPRFRFHLSVPAVFTVAILLLVLAGVVTARGWPAQARLFPLVVGLVAVGMCAGQLFLDLFRVSGGSAARIMDLEAERGVPGGLVARRAADIFGWILGLLASIWLIGFLLTVPLFMWLYLALRARAGWRLCLGYSAIAVAVLLGVFHYTLHIPWPQGVVAGPQEVLLQWLGG
ncbi:MAG: tripartite tricarboxylate transporter permease, partial [Deltaproteobacteria bacterium]|nr:tripartite tricarboxylate transporter permease [Deltaproteobacteria bacterium]